MVKDDQYGGGPDAFVTKALDDTNSPAKPTEPDENNSSEEPSAPFCITASPKDGDEAENNTSSLGKRVHDERTTKSTRPINLSTDALPDTSRLYDIDDFTRDEVMTVVREVFRDWEDVERDDAVKLVFEGLQQDGLAARRLGSNIRDKLESDLTAAVRRGIIHRERGLYNLDCCRITDYTREDLIKHLRGAIGRTWHNRDEAITATARYLGFRRTGKVIKETLKSTINSAIRRKEIERDGAKLIRKAK